MHRLKDLIKQQNGNVLIIFALAFTALLGLAGLAIDGGTIYMTKAELQKVANAAALSGGQELPSSDPQAVRVIVDEVVTKHNELASLQTVDITKTELEKSVEVGLEKIVPLPFLTLFGIDTMTVQANAKAGLGSMGRAFGAAPLGVNEFQYKNLVKGQEYQLKVDSGDSMTGNFGILALEGKGASTYEQTFRDGYSEELHVGEKVLVQTGNIAGSTREVVAEKVQSTCAENDRDCTRVILVLIYQPVCTDPATCTNYKEVKITGFAYFYISTPMDEKDTSITGKFIERVGTGFADKSALNSGAYTVKLMK